MKELLVVKVNEKQEPVISGRMLHEFLEILTPYKKWFDRMLEYGFIENQDYAEVLDKNVQKSEIGGRPAIDHAIKLDMAKELSMIQRSEKGRQARKYFIQIEKDWNSPEKIMARALKIANNTINQLSFDNERLTKINTIQKRQIMEMKPKASYYDLILNCEDLLSTTVIAKDYGWTAKDLNKYLSKAKIQFKQGGIWLLYQKYAKKGYTSTRTYNYSDKDGTEHMKVHTYWTQKGRLFIYHLLKNKGVLPLMERRNRRTPKRFKKRIIN